MNIFNKYAEFYDILYKEKDYEAECDFLESIFNKYRDKSIKNLLDVGCGTGGHVFHLSQRGYKITGVDISADMLKIAKRKAQKLNLNIKFKKGDMRNLNLNFLFDAAISMFSVMSYQTTNEDVAKALRSVRKHIKPNGLFIFDFWFGPAVITLKPSERIKIINKNKDSIFRLASPVLNLLKQIVEVKYTILRIRDDHVMNLVGETHLMRHFYPQEIELFLKENGFELLKLCPFLELERLPSDRDWNVAAIARAI